MLHLRRNVAPVLSKAIWVVVVACCCASVAMADEQEKPAVNGKNSKIQLSGVGWGTYRYLLADETQRNVPGTTLASKDMNTFDIDRVYLTADYAVDERISWQTTIEMQNRAGDPKIFLRKAFVKVKDPFGAENTFFQFGQIAHVMTPTVEKAWGLRIVSPIGIDRFLGVSTTWTGVGAGGTFANGVIDGELAITNERAYNIKTETKYKTFQGRVTIVPMPDDENLKGLKFSVWGQMNSNAPNAGFAPSASDNRNVWFGFFPSYQAGPLTVAAGVDMKKDKTPSRTGTPPVETVETRTSQLVSGWLAYDVTPKLRPFVRVEQYDPDTDADDDGYMVLNGGIAHQCARNVRGILDVEYAKYQEPKNTTLDTDVIFSARVEVTI